MLNTKLRYGGVHSMSDESGDQGCHGESDNETNQFENFAVDSVTTDTLETTTEHIDQIHDLVGQSGMDESYLSVDKMRIKTDRGVLLITAEDGKLEVREEDD